MRHIKYGFDTSAILAFGLQLKDVIADFVALNAHVERDVQDQINEAWESTWSHLAEVFISVLSADEVTFAVFRVYFSYCCLLSYSNNGLKFVVTSIGLLLPKISIWSLKFFPYRTP